MNHNDLPNDELLQFVFGELDDARQAAVRKAIAEDAELAATAQGLASAVAAVRAENVGQVERRFQRSPPAADAGGCRVLRRQKRPVPHFLPVL